MDKKLLYIGQIPIEFGGITRKGQILFGQLKRYHNTRAIFNNVQYHKKISFILTTIKLLLFAPLSKGVVFCIDSYRLYPMIKLQSFLWPKSIAKTIVVFNGGNFDRLKGGKNEIAVNILKKSKSVWVESKKLKDYMDGIGFNNTIVYPNPRHIDVALPPKPYDGKRPLRILYYSLICKDKGVVETIQAIKMLNAEKIINFSIDFYGRIDEEIKEQFNDFIDKTPNAFYKGINKNEDINEYYSVLNGYDIFVFPTKWKGEGTAGVCTEAKAAGIAIIASDHNFNSEIVREENNEGILVESGNVIQIVESIKKLYSNINLLNEIKTKSYESRRRYDVSEYTALYSNCF